MRSTVYYVYRTDVDSAVTLHARSAPEARRRVELKYGWPSGLIRSAAR